jgi:hypothetical protein
VLILDNSDTKSYVHRCLTDMRRALDQAHDALERAAYFNLTVTRERFERLTQLIGQVRKDVADTLDMLRPSNRP